jgi:hypothetical protein
MATMSKSDRRRPGGSFGYDIHIRQLGDGRSARVGAVPGQMLDTGGFELILVFPQCGDDCGLVHAAIPVFIVSHLNRQGTTAEEEAWDILPNVGGCMQRPATRLHE